MANTEFLGKWHAWKYFDKGSNIHRVVYTRTGNPNVGDETDITGYIRDDEFYSFNVWEDTVNDVKNGLRVNYNKTKGNRVVIIPDDRVSSGKVLEATGDFVPGSEGATYVFRYPGEAGGPFEDVWVVGETQIFDSQDKFDGTWDSFSPYYGPRITHTEACYYVVFDETTGGFVVTTECM